jgi:hypothetical protein
LFSPHLSWWRLLDSRGGGETYVTLFTGTTQVGDVVWRVTADYGFTTPSIDAVELVECPDGIDIIQGLSVEIVKVNYEDDVC